jgi:predicted transcriptional regulator
MSKRQERVLSFLQSGPATVKRLADLIGDDKRAVAYACNSLSRWGDIEKEGHTWKIKGS